VPPGQIWRVAFAPHVGATHVSVANLVLRQLVARGPMRGELPPCVDFYWLL
jgi:hypothetical protein